MSPSAAHAVAPGKLVLLGEYAVLEGAPALVMAVDRWARVSVRPAASDAAFVVRAPDVGLPRVRLPIRDGQLADAVSGDARLAVVAQVLSWAWLQARQRGGDAGCGGLEVTLDTSAFFEAEAGHKLGLGSSAAACVALVGAVSKAYGLDATDVGRGLPVAYALHRAAQGGEGSGVDVAASLLGGVLSYSVGGDGAPLADRVALPPTVAPLPVWSGSPASTPALVRAVRALRERHRSLYERRMARLAALSRAGRVAVSRGDAEGLLDIYRDYGDALASLDAAAGAGIVTAAHAQIAHLASRCGCPYKPSGAGGGDLGVALCPGDHARERLCHALRREGFVVVPLAIARRGLHSVGTQYPTDVDAGPGIPDPNGAQSNSAKFE